MIFATLGAPTVQRWVSANFFSCPKFSDYQHGHNAGQEWAPLFLFPLNNVFLTMVAAESMDSFL